MLDVGGVLSVDWLAMTRLACSVCGWTPISAKRFTIACWTFGSEVLDENGDGELSCWLERPHDQKTVPAPNTSAPLVGLRYSTRLPVAVPAVSTFPSQYCTLWGPVPS